LLTDKYYRKKKNKKCNHTANLNNKIWLRNILEIYMAKKYFRNIYDNDKKYFKNIYGKKRKKRS
jgi:protoporphyrinogen oxidase